MTKIMTTAVVNPVRGLGELPSPLKAIRAKCLDCCCGNSAEVGACPGTTCPIWPWRFGSGVRARRIIAQERGLSDVEGRFWADKLPNPMGLAGKQGHFATPDAVGRGVDDDSGGEA